MTPGTRLGPYEIVSPLGAGGMGEVYRGRDTRLDRSVAIKVLPPDASDSPQRRERFEREARAVSSLNHPHICTLHDVGRHDGVDYLVMELIEGETLAGRLERGPLPPAELLARALEIADALDKAHRGGVVHRDLKPANVMITRAGAKLLDFGLARTTGPAGTAGLSGLPTGLQNLTGEGTILGTLQYMAPEQLEGRDADARTDIFAFGSLVYEMGTARKAFEGKSQASVIASIMEHQPPPLSEKQPLAPRALDRLVARCLAKDPEDRWQSARDLTLELRSIATSGAEAAPAPAATRPARAWLTAALVVAALVAGAAASRLVLREPPRDENVVKLSLLAPERTSFGRSLALSPDGRTLVFEGMGDSTSSLWVRDLHSLAARRLAGTEEGAFPFWSPDGKWVGFFSGGKLSKIELATGTIRTLCLAREGRGGAWGPDGTIIFAPWFIGPLQKIPASGGEPVDLTTAEGPAGVSHRWPVFLPDGRHFLYLIRGRRGEEEWIYAASLEGGPSRKVLQAGSSVAYADGHLVYQRNGILMASPFDAGRLEITGEPTTLAEQVEYYGEMGPTRYAAFTVSNSGVLAYRPGSGSSARLAWFDREGHLLESIGQPGSYGEPALSPDGRTVAVARTDKKSDRDDIWLLELSRGVFTRFTHGEEDDATPVWSPDGRRILFSTTRDDKSGLFIKDLDTGSETSALVSGYAVWPDDWSPDGNWIVYEDNSPDAGAGTNLYLLPMKGGEPRPYVATPFDEMHGRISPDGHWLAYASDESGQREIYVQSFPDPGAKVQISLQGGGQPSWNPNGRELFYVAPDGVLTSVPFTAAAGRFEPGHPSRLFEAISRQASMGYARNDYLPDRDGRRVLVITPEQKETPPVTVVLNWVPKRVVR